ncbi:hypothetical protein LBMAG42_41340 [Deltaproteobacteria bacterium]|nr:hypothetical protein LBMAG42_41340 [Deltaproteobacteria bacterium]
MPLIDVVRNATRLDLTTEDGDPAPWALTPGLSGVELRSFEASLPCKLPDELRDLLSCCRGFVGGALDMVDFTGRDIDFEFSPAFPYGLPIASDGFGNFWLVDLQPESRTWGPIYFVCHDPAVVLVQSAGLESFLTELVKVNTPPYTSLIHDVREDAIFDVWTTNPGALDYEAAFAGADADIRAFALELGPSFQVVDLRNAPVGFGFSWGRYGPDSIVKRHGEIPIFAYQRRDSWWRGLRRRLLGR